MGEGTASHYVHYVKDGGTVLCSRVGELGPYLLVKVAILYYKEEEAEEEEWGRTKSM